MKPLVMCVGVAVEDRVYGFDKLPTKAQKYRANALTITGGGGAANAAVAVSRLGGQASLAARLGDDATASSIVADLVRDGVDCSLVRRFEGCRSSQSAVFIDGDGERLIANYRDAGLPQSADWLNTTHCAAKAIVADTKWPAGATRAMQLAADLQIPGVLDAEQPLDECESAIAMASHCIFSMQGLQSYRPNTEPTDAITTIARQHRNWVAVTDGNQGVYWSDGQSCRHTAAFTIEAIDTLGAGDTWHGAFALALAECRSESQAILFSNAAAAIKCSRFGGRDGIPCRAEVDHWLATHSVAERLVKRR